MSIRQFRSALAVKLVELVNYQEVAEPVATKEAIAAVITGLVDSGNSNLDAMPQEDLEQYWYGQWNDKASLVDNIYDFYDKLKLYGGFCRRWEERHNGTCCVVERVRDTYLLPKIRIFEEELEKHFVTTSAAQELALYEVDDWKKKSPYFECSKEQWERHTEGMTEKGKWQLANMLAHGLLLVRRFDLRLRSSNQDRKSVKREGWRRVYVKWWIEHIRPGSKSEFHIVNTPNVGEKGFYTQVTSLNSFRERETKRRFPFS